MKDNYSSRGFETLSVDEIPEYRSSGIHLRHRRTGAEVYRVLAEDEENLFSFTFKTPPGDHTGTPHILEHVVLSGSRRYPLKDPFMILLKGSTHTFLNALTYPDKTVYPAASMVKADFINLLRVYGDAVFFPSLKPEAFEQEGHRLEFSSENRLRRSGIVLNEMRGGYSSPESVAGDWILRSIFSDSPYRWDSGGDPRHIPELTYQAFTDFHRRFYHPSNVRIFLYGNHDTDEVLGILDDEFLSRFERRSVDASIPLQRPWSTPRHTETHWCSAPGESPEHKTTISMNWLLGESTDPREALIAEVLSFILLGHGGSPLQKAVLECGLGEDLSPVSGLETDLRQMVFSAGIRGTDPDKREAFETLVTRTLEAAAENLDADLVEGALRSVEFRGREIRGGYPFGMRLMNRTLRGWLHGRPPIESLAFEAPMAHLRRRSSPGFFEARIRGGLLENPHRSTVSVIPDPQLRERRERDEQKHLDELNSAMTPSERRELEASAQRLTAFQNEPDSPEDLARIPFLSRGDLPPEVIRIPMESGRRGGIPWYRHRTFCSGVVYLELAFDLRGLQAELQPWMPLFGRALTDVGLPGKGHDEVARELAMKTGGLSCSLEASPVHPEAGGGISLRLFVHLKALAGQWAEAAELCRELLLRADFSDEKRVGDLLVELRNDYRSAVVPSGHAFASLRAAAGHSPAAPWEELWYGVEQLRFLQAAAEREGGPRDAARALTAVRESALLKGGAALALTSDPENSSPALDTAFELVAGLRDGTPEEAGEPELFRHETPGESLAVPSDVSFSGLSLPAPILGSPEHARAGLLAHILRTGFLWETIRMKGGAYGASAALSGMEGTFTFSTYRDPVISPSLNAFRESLEWAAEHLDDDTLDLAIIGAVGKELKPLSPGERGAAGFKRALYGITDHLRQCRRDAQLAAVSADLRETARKLLDSWSRRSVSVIAGADALDEACRIHPELSDSRITLPS